MSVDKYDLDEIKEILLLQMVRYGFNKIQNSDKEGSKSIIENTNTTREFYLFDYFDKLIVKKGELTCLDCFGLNDTDGDNSSYVTSRLITLAKINNDESSPFFYDDINGKNVKPFLSLIFIDIFSVENKKNFVVPEETIDKGIVNNFLTACEKELFAIVQKFISCNDNSNDVEFSVYNSLNTGNFCVVVRSRYASTTYLIAAMINGKKINCQGDEDKDNIFPEVICSTYTTLGIEHRLDDNGQVINYFEEKNYKASALKDYNSSATEKKLLDDAAVVLRVAFKNMNDLKIVATAFHSETTTDNNNKTGLIGRYDLRIYLSMQQFRELYPVLCAWKFGDPYPPKDITKGEWWKLLYDMMFNKKIEIVNERFFFNTGLLNDILEGKDGSDNGDVDQWNVYRDTVYAQNNFIDGKLEELFKIKFCNYYYNSEYHNCLQLIKSVWESYCNLRSHVDSYINGNMFYVQIYYLLNSVKVFAEILIKESSENVKANHFYNQLFDCIRKAVNSINNYHLYLQSINRQSQQAPNYEIRVKMDMEKYLVAYTEFSHFLTLNNNKKIKKEHSNKRQYLLPIFTVDMKRKTFEVAPLFLLPYQQKGEIFTTSAEQEKIIMSMFAPNVECLGMPYSNLPILCHELSHNYRIQEREERNGIVAELVFEKISIYFTHNLLYYSSFDEGYTPETFTIEPSVYNIIFNIIKDVLYSEFYSIYGAKFDDINIGALISNIRQFLLDYIFYSDVLGKNISPEYSNFEQLMRSFKQIISMIDISELESEQIVKLEKISTMFHETVSSEVDYSQKNDIIKDLHKANESKIVSLFEEAVDKACMERIFDVVDTVQYVFQCFKEKCANDTDIEEQCEKYYHASAELLYSLNSDTDSFYLGIKQFYNVFINITRELLSTFGEEYRKEIIQGTSIVKYEIEKCCMELKDIHIELIRFNKCKQSLIKNFDNNNALKVRKKIIKEIFTKCRDALIVFDSDGKDDVYHIICDSCLTNKFLYPLGLWHEDIEIFQERFAGTVRYISNDMVNSIIDETVTLYREMFADIAMCNIMQINCFGYLKLVAYNNCAYEGIEAVDVDFNNDKSLALERILYAARILINRDSEDVASNNYEAKQLVINDDLIRNCFFLYIGIIIKKLKETKLSISQSSHNIKNSNEENKKINLINCGLQYFSSVYNCIVGNSTEKMREMSIDEILSSLCRNNSFLNIELDIKTNDQNVEEQIINIINDKIKEINNTPLAACSNEHLMQLQQELSGLGYLSKLLIMVVTRPVNNHRKVLDDFTKLFKIADKCQDGSNNDVLSIDHNKHCFFNHKISELYNNITWCSIQEVENKNFRDTLSFVLYFYYHNWYMYHTCLSGFAGNPDQELNLNKLNLENEINKRLDWLMGVD